jgi:hypothetical protein
MESDYLAYSSRLEKGYVETSVNWSGHYGHLPEARNEKEKEAMVAAQKERSYRMTIQGPPTKMEYDFRREHEVINVRERDYPPYLLRTDELMAPRKRW